MNCSLPRCTFTCDARKRKVSWLDSHAADRLARMSKRRGVPEAQLDEATARRFLALVRAWGREHAVPPERDPSSGDAAMAREPLARALGVSPQAIGPLLRGKYSPSFRALRHFCAQTGTSIDDVVFGHVRASGGAPLRSGVTLAWMRVFYAIAEADDIPLRTLRALDALELPADTDVSPRVAKRILRKLDLALTYCRELAARESARAARPAASPSPLPVSDAYRASAVTLTNPRLGTSPKGKSVDPPTDEEP